MARRPERALRLVLLGALPAGLGPGCAGTDPSAALAPLRVEPVIRLELSCSPPGPAASVDLAVIIAAGEGPLAVRGVRAGAASGEESLLDLDVAWTDFPGLHPVCTGHATRVLLPFGAGGSAEPGHPLVVERVVSLPPADGLLARRVEVTGRLIGVDFVRDTGHSGGVLQALPAASLQSFAPAPPGTLEEHLQSGTPAGIFVLAAAAPPERRTEVIDALVTALPSLGDAARQAAFAALLYLTGETNGQDIHRWRSWWKDRQHAREGR